MSSLQTNSHCRSGYWNLGLFCHTSESALPPPSSPAWTPLTHQCSTDPHIWTPQLPLVSQRDHEGNKEEELRLRERSHAVPEVQRCAETTHKPELMSKASARVCKPKLCWDKKGLAYVTRQFTWKWTILSWFTCPHFIANLFTFLSSMNTHTNWLHLSPLSLII